MSVREIRGKRLAARGLEEPDAKGPDAPAVSEPEAAQPAADQKHGRPDARLARKRDAPPRVEEAPDDQPHRQPRDQSDGYEGGEGEKDEHGRPLADDAFDSLHAVAREPPEAPGSGGADAVEQVDDAFRARFGGDAPPVPESLPVSRGDAIPVVEPPEPERPAPPADLSSLPTAEHDLSSLQPEVRRDPPRLGLERTGLQVQIHEAVKSTLPPSAPTRGEVPLDEISEPAPVVPPPAPRHPPLAGVPLGASRPDGSSPRAPRVPPPPASTGFEALEILSQIVRGTAPDAAAPRGDPPSSTTVEAIPAQREGRSIDAVPTSPAMGDPDRPPAGSSGTAPTVSIPVANVPPAARSSPVPAVTMPEMPVPPAAGEKAGTYPGASVVVTPVEGAGEAAPAPTSPTQVIPVIPSGEDEP